MTLHNRLAAAVVLHEHRVLVVRRSLRERFLPGVWGVPCGKLEPAERPEDGVLRELREEAGLDGQVIAAAGERTFVSEWDGRTVHNVQSNFLVRPLTLEIVLPASDQDHRWLPLDELELLGLDAHNLGTIRQALDAAQQSSDLSSRNAAT
ncbi:NUDIX hydrolase [Streptomyces sp. H10-C2]|nr:MULTISPECIES: NUDIX hydrolase [unclassified Streptomyces]MDJ0346248.1 NUDIX hydrolase [Streptomyces sp. PH10-H1]MDJ0371763.1 NUDIX hydrolase [Streptomyces sp. H10-C2]